MFLFLSFLEEGFGKPIGKSNEAHGLIESARFRS